MIVISDTSPLITLWKTGYLDLLPALYGQVIIPSAVESELRIAEYAESAMAIFAQGKNWILVREPVSPVVDDSLDPGEASAIALAVELKADLLLIDERFGRRVATKHGLTITGTIGVFEDAAKMKMLDLTTAFARLQSTDFRVSADFLAERLQAFNANNISG
jgi:predicted nucleic acid-binding protein